VIFRPDADGKPEQRFFHLQENGSMNRLLFETRVKDGTWCLDSFAQSSTGSKALMDRAKLHPAGVWVHVAATYDGHTYRNYVNGVLQGEAEVQLAPQSAGRTSVGVRINRVDYFKGAIRLSRFTKRALQPNEFLKADAK
jgi:mRNA degradation ribonuclease J1/J2